MRDSTSSWAVIDHDTLTNVFAMLPFDVKLACESVCMAWRQTLRHRPAAGVWHKNVFLMDNQKYCFIDLSMSFWTWPRLTRSWQSGSQLWATG